MKIVEFTIYKNSTPVITMNGCEMKVEDIVEAAIVGGINLLFVSERGEGKTQMLKEVRDEVFGGKGTYIRVSPDMNIKDIYTALNLEQLREKRGTTEEIIKITEKARHPFTAIDEFNRAPPIVQGQLLGVLDGYIEVNGVVYNLGIDIGDGKTYHVGMATINLDESKYLGTFGIDAAILDRFPIILDLDQFPPKPEDLIEILYQDVGLVVPQIRDKTSKVIEAYKQVGSRYTPLELLIIALYLREGVNYISVEPYSQRKTRGRIPEGVHESGDIQGIMFPISIRTFKNIFQVYRALDFVAEMRGCKSSEEYYYSNSLQILKLVLPHSGSLKKHVVNSHYYGNPYLATEDIIRKIKEKIEEKKYDIVEAFGKKERGRLSKEDLKKFEGEWEFIKRLLLRRPDESLST